MAAEMGLGEHLLLGKGETAAGGRSKPSILSDAMEAVLGAVYLDGGSDAAYDLIERTFGGRVTISAKRLDHADHKTYLQELTARLYESAPVYVLREEGPDHAKKFFATVLVRGRAQGTGEGRSKKQAEQAAARDAVSKLAPLVDEDGNALAESEADGPADASVAEGPADASVVDVPDVDASDVEAELDAELDG